MVPMEYCHKYCHKYRHKIFSNGQCQQCDKYSQIFSIDLSRYFQCHQSHFAFDQSLLFSHAKSCDGSILCPWLLWGQSPMAQRCWRTGDREGFTKDQTNLWRNDRFYCKEGGKHVTVQILKMAFVLYLCLIWCWILFKEGFTIGQLLDEVKKGNHFYIEAMKEDHLYLEVRK